MPHFYPRWMFCPLEQTSFKAIPDFSNLWMIAGDEQYRGAGGSSSGSPPASLLVVPQPLTVKPSHPSHLNSHLGGPHSHPPRKYQCKMCPQVSSTSRRAYITYIQRRTFSFRHISTYKSLFTVSPFLAVCILCVNPWNVQPI